MTNYQKSRALSDETIESLRNKSPNSTYIERTRLTAEALKLYNDLPQPLRCGRSLEYVLLKASCPVKKHDILLGRVSEKVPCSDEEEDYRDHRRIIEEFGYFTPDNGHTPFDWEEVVRIGIGGYIQKCEYELDRRRRDSAPEHKLLFLEGALLCYKAFSNYIMRYADAAREAGLIQAEYICRKIAFGAPDTFAEALQLVLLVSHIYSVYCVSENATLCCGRLDDYLLPFYLNDLSNCVMTEDDARHLIVDFNCKCSLVLGRGEHQMAGSDGVITGWERNPMFDSPTYVILGGYSGHGTHCKNPLTKLFLEEINPRLENPVYVFRRTNNDDTAVVRLAADKMRQNASLIVYNDETMIPAMINSGVEKSDAINYTIHGCNWPDLQGINTYRVLHLSLPMLIMNSLFDENTDPIDDLSDIDQIYAHIEKHFRDILRSSYRSIISDRSTPAYREYLRVSDCFKKGVLESAQAGESCIKYPFIHHRLIYLASAADMLASLEYNVCDGRVSARRMSDALKANFNGFDDVFKLCTDAPKYGHDDERADRHAKRLMTHLTDIIREESVNTETGERRVYGTTVMITDMLHIEEGKLFGATPDGRRAGFQFSENLSPSKGQSSSVTSLINSVTSIPFDRINSGVLNIRLSPEVVGGEDGIDRLTALFDVYFKRGGMQLQLSVTDREMLRAAQSDPDSYRDLMVRITGYSAVFVDMARDAQNEVISRDSLV